MRPRASSPPPDGSDVASSSSIDEDVSLGFWCLLSGKEVAHPSHPAKGNVRARVVLLHGWLMHHQCWLHTATTLRDRYGHDVLLLDFPGHGRSPLLPKYEDHNPENFVKRLRRVLERVGWAGGRDDSTSDEGYDGSQGHKSGKHPPLVLAGLSLGGVVSCLYADKYKRDVSRVVLVSSPGLDEKWWMPPNVTKPVRDGVLRVGGLAQSGSVVTGGPVGRWLVNKFPPIKTVLSHVRLIRDTPTFGVPNDMPQRLRSLKIPTTLVWGALDQFHSAQIKRWKAGRPYAADVGKLEETSFDSSEDGSKKDKGVHILVHPFWDHFAACIFLDKLRLGERAHFWHETKYEVPRRNELQIVQITDGKMRAKL